MGASHKAVLLLCLALVAGIAQAELPKNFQIILQTDNFPPFNMGPNNKHFARDAEVQGIGTDTVREIFKRAGIAYSLPCARPGIGSTARRWTMPATDCSPSPARNRIKRNSSGSGPSLAMKASYWPPQTLAYPSPR